MSVFLQSHKQTVAINGFTVIRRPVNLDHVHTLHKETDTYGHRKSWLIVFTTSATRIEWAYGDEAERDAEYENIMKVYGYQLDDPQPPKG